MKLTEIKNISYGPYERNKLDAYLVSADESTPVLIFFHGGGYVSGDKQDVQAYDLFQECLEQEFLSFHVIIDLSKQILFPHQWTMEQERYNLYDIMRRNGEFIQNT